MYDASLGARSNETSGRAILARQREGDVSTYHFIDNLSRALKHGGKILIDLIPKVYTGARIVRVLGPEGDVKTVPINQPVVESESGYQTLPAGTPPPEASRIFDLTAGKYDLTVEAGPKLHDAATGSRRANDGAASGLPSGCALYRRSAGKKSRLARRR